MGSCDDEVAAVAQRQSPNFPMMAVEFLNVLKLHDGLAHLREGISRSYLVSVPILQHFVLSYSPEIVGVVLERYLHNALVVGKNGLVAIAEVKTPNLDIFIGGAGYN
jgi:hypothetical protein